MLQSVQNCSSSKNENFSKPGLLMEMKCQKSQEDYKHLCKVTGGKSISESIYFTTFSKGKVCSIVIFYSEFGDL